LRVYKVIVVGPSQAGKTSLIRRFVEGQFIPDTKATIGVDFYIKNVETDFDTLTLQIWDTGGEERFKEILPDYVNGSAAVILAFDATNSNSFQVLNDFMQSISQYLPKDVVYYLVACKIDLPAKISESKMKEFIKSYENQNIFYIMTSALTGSGIEDLFQKLAIKIDDSQKKFSYL
jgi:Ras-related protein Rab-6A